MAANPDELAKSVSGYVGRALEKAEANTLFNERRTFVAGDRPETANVVEMAGAAFAYFAVVDGCAIGHWKDVLAGVMQFLALHQREPPQPIRIKELGVLITAQPADPDLIALWFTQNYH